MCASIPTTKQFFIRHLPHLIRTGRWPDSAAPRSTDFESSGASYANPEPHSRDIYEDRMISYSGIVLNQIITDPPKAHRDTEEQDMTRCESATEHMSEFCNGSHNYESRAITFKGV